MKSILVVSADAREKERIKAALTVQGWWVTEVDDRQVALRAAADQAPDVVIIDWEVAGAADLVESLGAGDAGPGTLLLTEGEAGADLPADDHLRKPVAVEELVRAVQRILTTPRTHGGGAVTGSGRRLTADEIFGDILREVEGGPVEPVQPPAAAFVPAEPEAPPAELEAPPSEPEALPPLELGAPPPLSGPPMPASEPPPPPGDVPELSARPPAPASVGLPSMPEEPAAEPGEAPDRELVELSVPAEDSEPETAEPVAPPVPDLVMPPAVFAEAGGGEGQVASAPVPEQFGQYELEERIAVGGMAEIWKARMTGVEGFEKTVAIKKILPHLTESEDFEKMFIDEAKLAAQLNHENIIHIYDLGKIADKYFIAMEYVDGKDLRSVLNAVRRRGARIPLGVSALISARLASALDYAHRRPDTGAVVHRDVSPRNVLLGYDGRIKLCDFGVAKAASRVGRTQIGAIKGKLQYMPPEQAWGQPVDGRSDIFSLGVVLFEMLTGQRLFAGDSEISLLEAVRECRTRPPREIDPGIPEELDRVVVRALRKNPDERYQTAGEMQRELEAFLYSLRPAPGSEDLAACLESVFAEPPPAAAADRSALPLRPGSGAGPAVELPSADAVAAIGHEPRRPLGRPLLYGLAAAALIAAAILVGVLAFGGGERREAAQAPPEAATPRLDPAAAEGPVVSPTEPATTPDPALPAQRPDATPAAVDVSSQVEIQDLVSRELARREAELRRLFEDQEQRLLQELEELRAEAAAARESGGDEGEGEGGGGGA